MKKKKKPNNHYFASLRVLVWFERLLSANERVGLGDSIYRKQDDHAVLEYVESVRVMWENEKSLLSIEKQLEKAFLWLLEHRRKTPLSLKSKMKVEN